MKTDALTSIENTIAQLKSYGLDITLQGDSVSVVCRTDSQEIQNLWGMHDSEGLAGLVWGRVAFIIGPMLVDMIEWDGNSTSWVSVPLEALQIAEHELSRFPPNFVNPIAS